MTTHPLPKLPKTYSPDPLADSRMSLGEHIEELRVRLWRALLALAIGLIASLFVGNHVVELLCAPLKQQLMEFQWKKLAKVRQQLDENPDLVPGNEPRLVQWVVNVRGLTGQLRLPEPNEEWGVITMRRRPVEDALIMKEAELLAISTPGPTTFTIQEPFVVYFKACLLCGAVISSPFVFWQLWAFVAAGLYPHERRWFWVYMPVSLALFLAGVALCQFYVLPAAVGYLMSYNDWMGFDPSPRLSDWLSFALLMPLVFGIAFQLPLVMLAVNRLGLVSTGGYRQHRRLAMFMLACLAIVLAAAPDWYSMLALTVPLWGLYELGILLCWFMPRAADVSDEPVTEAENLVEA
jgi:sec-independent protein translocase protein TatC